MKSASLSKGTERSLVKRKRNRSNCCEEPLGSVECVCVCSLEEICPTPTEQNTIPTPKQQTKSRALAILLVGTLKDAGRVSFPVWDAVDGRTVFVDHVASTHDRLEHLVW
jgi:hypothetical protein